jgi:hypothetical protein
MQHEALKKSLLHALKQPRSSYLPESEIKNHTHVDVFLHGLWRLPGDKND